MKSLTVMILFLVLVITAVVTFFYITACIVIVKQGTRKIVERFGSYRKTLSEGIHIIFRPFDRIAPVPWDVLSIGERDEFNLRMMNSTYRKGYKKDVYLQDLEDSMGLSVRNAGNSANTEQERQNLLTKKDIEFRQALEKDIVNKFRANFKDSFKGYRFNPQNHTSVEVEGNWKGKDRHNQSQNNVGIVPFHNINGEKRKNKYNNTFAMNEDIISEKGGKYSRVRGNIANDARLDVDNEFGYEGEGSYLDKSDIYSMIENAVGKTVNELVDNIAKSNDLHRSIAETYSIIGIEPSDDLLQKVAEREALMAAVKYYPRHQDPKNAARYPKSYHLAENHILDYVDLRERHIDTEFSKDYGSLELITKDNASVKVNTVIFFCITDPYMYYYGAEEPERSMVLLAITNLRNLVANLTLEEALQARGMINTALREALDDATNNWGIKVNRVEIKEFVLKPEMREAMDRVLIAERNKRADIISAEGTARTIELKRTAEAEGYKKIRDASLSPEVLKIRGYEALKDVADGKATKIFMPNDLSGLVTGAHVVADAFKDSKVEEPVEAVVVDKTKKSKK